MKIKYNYESDADAVVIEILDASAELSKLFKQGSKQGGDEAIALQDNTEAQRISGAIPISPKE